MILNTENILKDVVNSASKYNLIRHLALGERGYEIDYPRAKKMCLEMMDDPTYGSMVRELMKLL